LAPIALIDEKVFRLEPATEAIQTSLMGELAKVQQGLTALDSFVKARQEIEARTADSVGRLEMIIAGTQSKGSAGENIVEVVLAKLPIEWQVRNFNVKGKTVEFGLRLPNNLVLPIDSKWPATHLLEQFAAAHDPEEQKRLKDEIEKLVLQKAKEVGKYIDPDLTMPFGIPVVLDSVFDLSSGVLADVYKLNVVLVSYSMLIPYLMLVLQTTLKTMQTVDMQKLDAYLQAVQNSIQAMQDELDGRFAKALTMLANSRDDMCVQIGKASSNLTSLQISTSPSTPALLGPEAPEETKI
jgi:DNA recombination protein RmuC